MIWPLMMFVSLWTLWLSACALLIEKRLLTARVPVRLVWILAIALSTIAPAAALIWANRGGHEHHLDLPRGVELSRARPVIAVPTPASDVKRALERVHASVAPISPIRVHARWPSFPSSDSALGALWLAGSLLTIVYVMGGVLRLRMLRREWTPHVVNRVAVMISENTGPAVVGILRPVIVLPKCVLPLDDQRLSLMLKHESEHLAAKDAHVLALAEFAVVLAPWNPMLWWQLRRLRLAVELDCDARVLDAFPDFVAYGSLLLEMGSGPRAALSGAGFAQHAPQLESRIRRLTVRPRGRQSTAIAMSAVVACVAVAVGCALPAPMKTAVPAIHQIRLQSSRAIGVSTVVAKVGVMPPSSVAPPVVEDRKITVNWENAPILDVLSYLGKFGERTILPSPRVTGFVSAYFVGVPWRSVLDSVVKANGYAMKVGPDSVIIVDSFDSIAAPHAPPVRRQRGLNVPRFFNIGFSRSVEQAPASGVSIIVRDFALADLTIAIAEASGRTLVGSRSIGGSIDAALGHRNWDELLTRILDDHGYSVSFTSREVIVSDTSRQGARAPTRTTSAASADALLQRRWWSWSGTQDDTTDAANFEPGCSAQPADSNEIVLLVNNAATARAGHLAVQSVPTSSKGMWVEYTGPNQRDEVCGVGRGAIRIVGFGANGVVPVVVGAGSVTSLVVKTASGRLVAGPVQVKNEASIVVLEWPAGIR